jgi:hypothetical protein
VDSKVAQKKQTEPVNKQPMNALMQGIELKATI